MIDRVLTIAGVIERLSFAQLAYAGGTPQGRGPLGQSATTRRSVSAR